MGLGFFPNRDCMIQEVDQWIKLKKLDMLAGLCNCCTYKAFDLAKECRTCKVRRGIRMIVLESRRERELSAGDELLGVC